MRLESFPHGWSVGLRADSVKYERHFTRFSGWWKTGEDLYLLTELMRGGDLGNYINQFSPDENTYLTEIQAKIIAKKLLEATAIMHSRGIIHRDLKPSVRRLPCDSFVSSCFWFDFAHSKTRGRTSFWRLRTKICWMSESEIWASPRLSPTRRIR